MEARKIEKYSCDHIHNLTTLLNKVIDAVNHINVKLEEIDERLDTIESELDEKLDKRDK